MWCLIAQYQFFFSKLAFQGRIHPAYTYDLETCPNAIYPRIGTSVHIEDKMIKNKWDLTVDIPGNGQVVPGKLTAYNKGAAI